MGSLLFLNFERFRSGRLPISPVTVKLWESTGRAGGLPVYYYQSPSFHDAAYLRRLLGRTPAPEFQRWLVEQGYRCDRTASAKGFRVFAVSAATEPDDSSASRG